jgi:hypothetical protein
MAENMEEKFELEPVIAGHTEDPGIITVDKKETATTSVSIEPIEETDDERTKDITDNVSPQPCPSRSVEYPTKGIIFVVFLRTHSIRVLMDSSVVSNPVIPFYSSCFAEEDWCVSRSQNMVRDCCSISVDT